MLSLRAQYAFIFTTIANLAKSISRYINAHSNQKGNTKTTILQTLYVASISKIKMETYILTPGIHHMTLYTHMTLQ